MEIIDGKRYASEILSDVQSGVLKIKRQFNISPGLAVILVGDDPSSIIYTENKVKTAKSLGIISHSYRLPYETQETDLLALLDNLNNDSNIHGILVQMPLPPHINTNNVINGIHYLKDVDGFHIKNVGLLNTNQKCLAPCTPQGIITLLKKTLGDNLSGKKACVVGRSRVVGMPLIMMLIQENCTVTGLHSKSINLSKEAAVSDILISAAGCPRMIDKNYVKEGACVIDVGITRVDNKIYGDVDFESVKLVAGYITPVPGGVGPMTIAYLMHNTVKAFLYQT